jgi:hypothetical protein
MMSSGRKSDMTPRRPIGNREAGYYGWSAPGRGGGCRKSYKPSTVPNIPVKNSSLFPCSGRGGWGPSTGQCPVTKNKSTNPPPPHYCIKETRNTVVPRMQPIWVALLVSTGGGGVSGHIPDPGFDLKRNVCRNVQSVYQCRQLINTRWSISGYKVCGPKEIVIVPMLNMSNFGLLHRCSIHSTIMA